MSNQCSSLPNKRAAVNHRISQIASLVIETAWKITHGYFFFFNGRFLSPLDAKCYSKSNLNDDKNPQSSKHSQHITTLLRSLLLDVLKCKAQNERGKV